MRTKDDPALVEVWEMKKQVQKDFEKSGFDNFIDFIKDEAKEESFYEKSFSYILSQSSLERDWNRPEEDDAWAYLQ